MLATVAFCVNATMTTIATEFPEKAKDAEREFEEIEYRTLRNQVLDKSERVWEFGGLGGDGLSIAPGLGEALAFRLLKLSC